MVHSFHPLRHESMVTTYTHLSHLLLSLPSIPPSLADTNSQSTGIEKIINRKYLLKYLTQKQTTCMKFQTSVPIPSCISKRCTKASLEILIFPYVKESSPWPERYSYIQLCLTIPKAYLIPLTVTYSCKLVFSLSVTAHKPQGEEDELPERETPIEITMDVGERVCDSAKIKLICHTHLLDTLCEGVKFLGNAYFKLTPKHVTIPEYKMADDYVDIDAPPMEIDATPPLTDEEITPPLVDEEAAPPPTDKETTPPLVDAPPPTDKETTLHEEAIPPPMDEEDAPPVV